MLFCDCTAWCDWAVAYCPDGLDMGVVVTEVSVGYAGAVVVLSATDIGSYGKFPACGSDR